MQFCEKEPHTVSINIKSSRERGIKLLDEVDLYTFSDYHAHHHDYVIFGYIYIAYL